MEENIPSQKNITNIIKSLFEHYTFRLYILIVGVLLMGFSYVSFLAFGMRCTSFNNFGIVACVSILDMVIILSSWGGPILIAMASFLFMAKSVDSFSLIIKNIFSAGENWQEFKQNIKWHLANIAIFVFSVALLYCAYQVIVAIGETQ